MLKGETIRLKNSKERSENTLLLLLNLIDIDIINKQNGDFDWIPIEEIDQTSNKLKSLLFNEYILDKQ